MTTSARSRPRLALAAGGSGGGGGDPPWMTPRLQKAIELLQKSRLELIAELRKEYATNAVVADPEEPSKP